MSFLFRLLNFEEQTFLFSQVFFVTFLRLSNTSFFDFFLIIWMFFLIIFNFLNYRNGKCIFLFNCSINRIYALINVMIFNPYVLHRRLVLGELPPIPLHQIFNLTGKEQMNLDRIFNIAVLRLKHMFS